MKVLVVEDNEEYYEGYFLRFAGHILPEGSADFVRASTLPEAVLLLREGEWDAIVMDFDLPRPSKNTTLPNGEPLPPVRTGADLVQLRRASEPAQRRSVILGNSSHIVGGRAMQKCGANQVFSKLDAEGLMKTLKGMLPK